ncbi:MAG: hypothetical protein ACSHWW_05865 [Nonlabens sp.]
MEKLVNMTDKNYSDTFKTELGDFNFNFLTDTIVEKEISENHTIFKTDAHQIELFKFDNFQTLMKNDLKIDDSYGWIVRITKTSSIEEKLLIRCCLELNDENVFWDYDSGECLDALRFYNNSHVVSIGTEDGEMMKSRSVQNDWMPRRFEKILGFQNNQETSFTKYKDNGFETEVPRLFDKEKIYFHYLVATKSLKVNEEFANEVDISTHLAIDIPKRVLIEKLEIVD